MQVFISYRYRSVAAGAAFLARDLARQLRDVPGVDIYFDLQDHVPANQPAPYLRQVLGQSGVLIAVIDPDWESVTNSDGVPLLLSDKDYVRWEIAFALGFDGRDPSGDPLPRQGSIPVLPVLLGGRESMPKQADLPAELHRLLDSRPVRIGDVVRRDSSKELAGLILSGPLAEYRNQQTRRADRVRRELEQRDHVRQSPTLRSAVEQLNESNFLRPHFWRLSELHWRPPFTSVQVVWDEQRSTFVVAKLLLRQHLSREALSRFRAEHQRLRDVHAVDGVVKVDEVIHPTELADDDELLQDVNGAPLFYTQRWFPIGSLADVLEAGSLVGKDRRSQEEDRWLSRDEIKSIALQLLDTLRSLHDRPIWHRDIRPENILVRYNHNGVRCLLTNLDVINDAVLNGGAAMPIGGSAWYRPPDFGDVTAAPMTPEARWEDADIYAVAMVVAELLASRRRERFEPAETLLDGITLMPSLSEALARGLSPGRAGRFDRAASFRNALEAADFRNSNGVDDTLPVSPTVEAFPVVAAGVALNVLGMAMQQGIQGPLFLDTIGTATTAMLLGPGWGMVVGVATNTVAVLPLHDDALTHFVPWVPVQLAAALTWGTMSGSRSDRFWPGVPPVRALLGRITIAAVIIGTIATVVTFAYRYTGVLSSVGVESGLFGQRDTGPPGTVGQIAMWVWTFLLQVVDKWVATLCAVGLLGVRVRLGGQYLHGQVRPGRQVDMPMMAVAHLAALGSALCFAYVAAEQMASAGTDWVASDGYAVWIIVAPTLVLLIAFALGEIRNAQRKGEVRVEMSEDSTGVSTVMRIGAAIMVAVIGFHAVSLAGGQLDLPAQWTKPLEDVWASSVINPHDVAPSFSAFLFRLGCLLTIPAAITGVWKLRRHDPDRRGGRARGRGKVR